MAEPWDKKDFEELARSHMEREFAPGTMLPHLQTFFNEALAHYEDATADGKAFVDKAMANIIDFFESMLKDAPDTADMRRMRRLIGLGKGKHFKAQSLIDNFPILPVESDSRIDEAKNILCVVMQCLLDLLHDATRSPQSGAAKISILGLFYWLIDELTVAQFLARRSYATLAYTHLRTILEILDKIELFTRFPEFVEIWGSNDDDEIWRKLAPARVREKLGRDSRDPMYRYFSQEGSHATFRAMQPRLRKKQGASEDEKKIAIMFGGVREPARQVSVLIYCILVTTQAIIKAATVFEDRLNPQDVTQLVASATDDCFAFFGRFLDSVDRSKDDITSLEIILASWQKMREDGLL